MNEKYTELGHRAVFCARYEAHTRGATLVRPEHLILGLLRADRQLLELCAPELTVDQIRATLEPRLSRHRVLDRKNLIPFSRATRRVLKLAKNESDSSGHSKIGTEHILAGLIREAPLQISLQFGKRSRISIVLRESGVDPDQILQKIRAGQLDWRPQDKHPKAALGFFKPIHDDVI